MKGGEGEDKAEGWAEEWGRGGLRDGVMRVRVRELGLGELV